MLLRRADGAEIDNRRRCPEEAAAGAGWTGHGGPALHRIQRRSGRRQPGRGRPGRDRHGRGGDAGGRRRGRLLRDRLPRARRRPDVRGALLQPAGRSAVLRTRDDRVRGRVRRTARARPARVPHPGRRRAGRHEPDGRPGHGDAHQRRATHGSVVRGRPRRVAGGAALEPCRARCGAAATRRLRRQPAPDRRGGDPRPAGQAGLRLRPAGRADGGPRLDDRRRGPPGRGRRVLRAQPVPARRRGRGPGNRRRGRRVRRIPAHARRRTAAGDDHHPSG